MRQKTWADQREMEQRSGLMMHDTLAFTEDGVPLGLLDVQCWPRKPEEAGKGHYVTDCPLSKKKA